MVHSLTPKAGLLSMIAAYITRVPVRIHTFTGLVFPTATGIQQKILILTDRITCYCANYIIPEGEGVKKDLEKYHITHKPLHIIGNGNINGIDMAWYNCTEEICRKASQLRNPESTLTFCCVGRLVRDKGIIELVNAFSRLHKEYPTIFLFLVGTFEEEDPLPRAIHNTIREHPAICFTGWQEDIRPYLAASDVFVFPSYREGFPNVVLQAGAMNLPSIVTDINGSNEIIIPGENGIIIPAKDEETLYQAMKKP